MLQTRKRKTKGDEVELEPLVDLYGFRGSDPRVWYLNPWEFLMYWCPMQITHPGVDDARRTVLTRWTAPGKAKWNQQLRRREPVDLTPGVDYVVKAELAECADVVILPDIEPVATLRHQWVLRRRRRPVVPQPAQTPMPDQRTTQEEKT